MADDEVIGTYSSSVSELLTIGDVRGKTGWRDYLQNPGLTAEHIPELIRMVSQAPERSALELWHHSTALRVAVRG